MEILSHGALLNSNYNTLEGVKYYTQRKIGIELDLRIKKNIVYMSHDSSHNGDFFEEACKILVNSKMKLALHIKEIDAVKETLRLIKKYAIENYFLFSTDNNPDFSKLVNVKLRGFYATTTPSNVNEKILWCDEVNSKWYNEKIISNLHKENKTLYSISKELIEPCEIDKIKSEWKRLKTLKFDGICTNYPIECLSFFTRGDLI